MAKNRFAISDDVGAVARATRSAAVAGAGTTPTEANTATHVAYAADEEYIPDTTPGSVVVGVDSSPESRAALRWGTHQAQLLGAVLTLCHTYSITGLAGNPRVTSGDGEASLEHATATAARHLDRARISAVIGHGDPARVLARVSRGASLLVIGTHGYFAHGASLYEPKSLRIIAGAACPVVVHPLLARQSGPYRGQVVVGVDGSPASRAALGFAYAHAATHGLSVAAIHVCASDKAWASSVLGGQRRRTEPTPEEFLAGELEPYEVLFEGVQTQRAVFSGHAVPGLLRASAGAEILVIGDRGQQPGPASTMLGSVAQHMVGNGTCPVAVIRSADPAGG